MQEPSSEELAVAAHVDHGRLVGSWLREARALVAEEQAWIDAHTTLGGAGIDVEFDEIRFRARAVTCVILAQRVKRCCPSTCRAAMGPCE